MKSDLFVFELSTEEIPAFYQKKAEKTMEQALTAAFKEHGLIYSQLSVFSTPRRLGFFLIEMKEATAIQKKEYNGPAKEICFAKDGSPSPALQGFSRKVGLTPAQISFKLVKGKEVAHALVDEGGLSFQQIISQAVNVLLEKISFPKSMRWGHHTMLYARPVLGYFSAFGSQLVSLDLDEKYIAIKELRSLRTGFCQDDVISPLSAQEYFDKVAQCKIVLDAPKRRSYIEDELNRAAESLGCQLHDDSHLLDEVTHLVERPEVIIGKFDEEFLEIPEPVILSEMIEHQRYFPLFSAGQVSNKFLIVANTPIARAEDFASFVQAGNERVLRARLSDGAFFYQEDLKTKLKDRVEKLKSIVYLEGFGSIFDKSHRIEKLAIFLAGKLNEQSISIDKLQEAAYLLKVDLTTNMVYEFDHLQGEIGAIYARQQGLDDDIALAIEEHYLPKRQGDSLPSTLFAAILGAADKLDNLLTGFCSGNQPTSSQDPMGLRRQLLYLVEIIMSYQLSFDLKECVEVFWSSLAAESENKYASSDDLLKEFWPFVQGRIKTVFDKSGFSPQMIRAGLHSQSEMLNIYTLYKKLEGLRSVSENQDKLDAIMTSFVRMKNLLNEATDFDLSNQINSGIFEKDAEHDLLKLGDEILNQVTDADQTSNFSSLFSYMADNSIVVDKFFDEVMVNDSRVEIRQNRLLLLNHMLHPIEQVLALEELK